MSLYNLQGTLLKSKGTKSGKRPNDKAVTKRGYLIYTDKKEQTVHKVKNTQIESVIRLQRWKPISAGPPLVTSLLSWTVKMVNKKK